MKKYRVWFEEETVYEAQIVEASSELEATDLYDLENASWTANNGRYVTEEIEG